MSTLASSRRSTLVLSASTTSLRRRILLAAGAVSLVVLGGAVAATSTGISRYVRNQAAERLRHAAQRSAFVLERMLADRREQTEALAASPLVVDAARAAAERAAQLKLGGLAIDELEARFGTTRSLAVDPRADLYFRSLGARLGVAEAFVTDVNGYTAAASELTTDFVQSDETWWQVAIRGGVAPAVALFDESARQVVISFAAPVRPDPASAPLGVLRMQYGLGVTDASLGVTTSSGEIRVDLIDAEGNVIASSRGLPRMRPLPGYGSLAALSSEGTGRYSLDGTSQLATVLPTNSGRWRVVAHIDEAAAMAEFYRARRLLLAGALGLLALALIALWGISLFLARHITGPAATLANAAEAVAAGDLRVEIAPSRSGDEIGRLSRATATMIAELRRLAGALHGAAHETSSMAAEITAGATQMSTSAQEMALTSNDLSQRSTDMAETIQKLAADASQLLEVAGRLDRGAQEGVERNTRLRALSRENRERLDESTRVLDVLSEDVQAAATAAEGLAGASEEIRAFVTFVKKIARQSKLLALNASMEAARAGEHGQGFAVVAAEVRRLAAGAGEAAERTETLVEHVLERVAESRTSALRTTDTVKQVLGLTQSSTDTFGRIESEVEESETWTTSIRQAAEHSNLYVAAMTQRLDSLAEVTESFASAMHQVAAASEEQSASTQEIAAAAEHLTSAAEQLATLVRTFQLHGETPVSPAAPAAPEHAGAPVTPPTGALPIGERADAPAAV